MINRITLINTAALSIPKTPPASLFKNPRATISTSFSRILPIRYTKKTTTIKVIINEVIDRYLGPISRLLARKSAA